MNLTPQEQADLVDLIRLGSPEHPIRLDRLSDALGLSEDQVRRAIRELVNGAHLPIGSSCDSHTGGYFWIFEAGDLREAGSRLVRAGIAHFMRAKALGWSLPEMVGQLALEFSKETINGSAGRDA